MPRTSTWLASVLLAFASATAAFADVVHLKDGGSLEGQVVVEESDRLVVRTPAGTTVVVPRGQVLRVERGVSVEEQHKARLKKVDPRDAEARYALGQWLKSLRRIDLARREFLAVLLVEPEHRFARSELGQVRQGGKWVEVGGCGASAPALPSREESRPGAERTAPSGDVSELVVASLGCSSELAAALVDLRGRDKARAKAARTALQDLEAEKARLTEVLAGSGPASDRAWRGIMRARGESFMQIPCDRAAIEAIAQEHLNAVVAPALSTLAPDLQR